MLVFPNCKINLGVHVLNKRPDGYHTIETVFYPVNWHDALEIIENKDSGEAFVFSQSGLAISGRQEDNLIYKAWKIIAEQKKCRPVKVHLHKTIPMGAGLGGGSADAAFFINSLNNVLQLGYSAAEKTEVARRLGSDCAFFINNQPVFAQEKGDVFTEINLDLSAYYILVVYPGLHSSTAEAYARLSPGPAGYDLKSIIETKPVAAWKEVLVNDFEASIFKKYPPVKALKETLYAAGALYAGMSGSGSAVFGIFDKEPPTEFPENYSYCVQKPAPKIL